MRPGLKGSKERECAFIRVCSNVLDCLPKQWAFREILSLEKVSGKNHVLVGSEESYVKFLSWKLSRTEGEKRREERTPARTLVVVGVRQAFTCHRRVCGLCCLGYVLVL